MSISQDRLFFIKKLFKNKKMYYNIKKKEDKYEW